MMLLNRKTSMSMRSRCRTKVVATKAVVEPYGLWLLMMMRNPSDVVVEQDDRPAPAVEVCMLAHHLVADVAAQPLMLSICTSPSLSLSLYLLYLMMNDVPG